VCKRICLYEFACFLSVLGEHAFGKRLRNKGKVVGVSESRSLM